MKVLKLLWVLLPAMISPVALVAQNDSIYKLTLDQAKQMAIQNNLELQNASLDVKAAKRKIWETTAMGLPHASGSGSYSYMLTIPSIYKTFIEQNIPQGTPDDIRDSIINATLDEMRASTAFDVNVSQLIFSGSYIVGLQTSRIYKNLSTYSYEATQNSVLENVITSYTSVLVAKENIDVLKKTLKNVEETSAQMKKMYETGVIDEISYSQVSINRLTLKNSLSQIERQYSLAVKLLKYQMGLDFSDSLVLTENLNDLILSFEDNNYLNADYVLESDINYKLVKTQEDLMKQNFNLNKTNFLPTLSAYYAYHKNLNSQSVDFQPQDIVGLQLSVPIFSSGERMAQLSQAKISYEKAKNTSDMTSQMLTIGVNEAKSSYISALDQVEFNRDNLELATKVYDQTLEKNKLGMASSTDLSQAQNQLLSVQRDYYMAIFQLVSAKVKLDKAYNKL